jgi:hypothetical protein
VTSAFLVAVTRALQAHAWPAGQHVRVHMGVHTGEAAKTATGLVGLEVHRAAKVAAVGYGGLSRKASGHPGGGVPAVPDSSDGS